MLTRIYIYIYTIYRYLHNIYIYILYVFPKGANQRQGPKRPHPKEERLPAKGDPWAIHLSFALSVTVLPSDPRPVTKGLNASAQHQHIATTKAQLAQTTSRGGTSCDEHSARRRRHDARQMERTKTRPKRMALTPTLGVTGRLHRSLVFPNRWGLVRNPVRPRRFGTECLHLWVQERPKSTVWIQNHLHGTVWIQKCKPGFLSCTGCNCSWYSVFQQQNDQQSGRSNVPSGRPIASNRTSHPKATELKQRVVVYMYPGARSRKRFWQILIIESKTAPKQRSV